jgi:hypothetical protein
MIISDFTEIVYRRSGCHQGGAYLFGKATTGNVWPFSTVAPRLDRPRRQGTDYTKAPFFGIIKL